MKDMMEIRAVVDRADYNNMVRYFWDKDYIDAEVVIGGKTYKKTEIGYRGTSSLFYPKKSFKIKFSKKEMFEGGIKRLDLSAGYVDKSLIREMLCFDLFHHVGSLCSETWHAHLVVETQDGEVVEDGVFTVFDHVDSYFFERRGLEVGSMYKGDGGVVNGELLGAWLDIRDVDTLKILYDQQYSAGAEIEATGSTILDALLKMLGILFKEPMAQVKMQMQMAAADARDYGELVDFIQAVNSLDPADSNMPARLDTFLDTENYLDWLAVNTIVQSNDVYHKNYYLHKRPYDGRWEIIPWDYDLTFGRNWNDYCKGLCEDLSEGTSIKGEVQMRNRLSRGVLANDYLYNKLLGRVLELLGSWFVEEDMAGRVDAYYEEISRAVHLDAKKWPTNEQFDAERERLKDWIRRRRKFLYKELEGYVHTPAEIADTVVTGVNFEKEKPVEGDSVNIYATVRNVGSATTGGTVVGVAFLIDGEYITFGTTGPIEKGASRQVKSVSPWKAKPGDHRLTAIVDDVNRYPEANETNNSLEIAFHVEPLPPQALGDTRVDDIYFEKGDAGATLVARVSNVGGSVTADMVGVAFFADDRYVTFGTADPIKPGKSVEIRANDQLDLTGTHKITAIVDDVNRYPESDESNNVLSKLLDFGGPARLADTIILELTFGRDKFTAGESVYFEAVVKNVGGGRTGDIVGVAFLVDDGYVTFGTSAPLEPDEIKTIRSVSLWKATVGDHRLIAVVDDVNRYPEVSETNNRFELAFHVEPAPAVPLGDTVVKDVSFEKGPDGKAVLSALVANVGEGRTADVVGVAFFVDGGYATYGVSDPMGPGESRRISAVHALALSGIHDVTAVVDDVNRYPESDERNNALSKSIKF